MIKIDFKKLQEIAINSELKKVNAYDTSICLNEYMNYLTNYMLKCKELSESELSMLTISEQNWIIRKDYFVCKVDAEIGDVFYVDLGKNYKPECSYGHPVLIVEKLGNMFFVVPVSSNKEKVVVAYHPIDNKDGNDNLRKVTSEDGFNGECALLLSNGRTISGGRLLDKKYNVLESEKGKKLFKEIKDIMLKKYFPKYEILLNKYKKDNEYLIKQNEMLKDEILKLKSKKD